MRKPVLFGAIFCLVVAACGKDKFNTRPSLELKSISSNIVPLNGDLVVTFKYTDKEGDIGDTLFVKKIRTNENVLPTIRDSFPLAMPTNLPDKTKGEIRLNLQYQNHLVSAENPGTPPDAASDSLIFKFALKDKGGNISDTVTTDIIVIERQ